MAQTPSGDLLVIAGIEHTQPGRANHLRLIGYDPETGLRRWEASQAFTVSDVGGPFLAVTPDGGRVLVAGGGAVAGFLSGYWAAAFDARDGSLEWLSTYRDGQIGRHIPGGLALDSTGGRVFVTGESWDGSDTFDDFATVALDAATGATLWVARYDGPDSPSPSDRASAIALTSDGTVAVAGWSGEEVAVVAHDPGTGSVRWVYREAVSGRRDQPVRLAAAPGEDRIFLTVPADSEVTAVALRASDGFPLWTNTLDTGDQREILADADHLYVVGERETGSVPDRSDPITEWTAVALGTSDGAVRWQRAYRGLTWWGADRPRGASLSPDGGELLVAGTVVDFWSDLPDYAAAAFRTSNGTLAWSLQYGGYDLRVAVADRRINGPFAGTDIADAVLAHPDGQSVFLTGHSRGLEHNREWTTIAFRPSCTEGPISLALHTLVEPVVGRFAPMAGLVCTVADRGL